MLLPYLAAEARVKRLERENRRSGYWGGASAFPFPIGGIARRVARNKNGGLILKTRRGRAPSAYVRRRESGDGPSWFRANIHRGNLFIENQHAHHQHVFRYPFPIDP